MLLHIKRICPDWICRYARTSRQKLYHTIDLFLPYLTSRTYKGFKLYYTRGAGLIDRIRIGSTQTTYEPELVNAIIAETKSISNPVFIDIGTNIGLISLSILHSIPHAQIFGFEPSPIAYKSFATTIFANKLEQKIHLFNYAIDERAGHSTFAVHNDKDSSGDGLINTHRAHSPAASIQVLTTTLDAWWTEAGKPHIDVIKMDIEGAELRALRGAVLLLQNVRPKIFLEISLANLKVYPYNHHDILAFLHTHNYNIETLDKVLCTKDNLDSIMAITDSFIAVPKT